MEVINWINYDAQYKLSNQNVKLTRLEMELAEAGLPYKASSPGILTCGDKNSQSTQQQQRTAPE